MISIDKPDDKHMISINAYHEKVKQYRCEKCDKIFSHYQSRWRHVKGCKGVNDINENEIIDGNTMEKMKKDLEDMKELLQKALKIHPKTLQKINKQLTNTNNGVIQNADNINNINIQIIQLGKENLKEILSPKEKLKILNKQAMSINHLIELIHASDKYQQFKNVLITNLQSSFCYKYDDKMNAFIAVNKDELLNDILDARIYDINTFHDELGHLMDTNKSECIKKFLEKMDDENGKMRNIKKDEIKLILYNNRHKIKDGKKIGE